MQLASAFSRPQTVPAVPKAAPKKALWILNSWRDLILYVGTPLFLVPMFLLAQARRLDFATCATWFAAAVLLSPQRMTDTLETYYASGGPFIPPSLLRNGQQVVLAVAIVVGILFLFNFSRMWAEGKRPNPVKLALQIGR